MSAGKCRDGAAGDDIESVRHTNTSRMAVGDRFAIVQHAETEKGVQTSTEGGFCIIGNARFRIGFVGQNAGTGS